MLSLVESSAQYLIKFNTHAPLKTFQVRNNYVPFLPEYTKQMTKAREAPKKEAIDKNCDEKYESYKRLRN